MNVNKKQKRIMIWMIVWAGLFIAVLYSPIGSPDLYSSQSYYSIENRTANFTNNVIPNASKVRFTEDNNSPELEIPDISSSGLRSTMGGAGSYRSGGISSSGSYGGGSSSQPNPGNSYSAAGSIGSGGVSIIASSGSRSSSSGSSGIVMTNGIASLTTTSLSNTNTTTRQLANQTLTGGTDPGGDPTGDPIPVGDGWGLLALFAVCYAGIKTGKLRKRKVSLPSQEME